MTIDEQLHSLRRRFARLQLVCASVALGATALLACGAYTANADAPVSAAPSLDDVQELTVERLNVREPDGTIRLVLSNTARAPDPVVDGKPVSGRKGGNGAGLIFYDENGNESGGLTYGGRDRDGAGSWFAFDRHDQDQTLGLGYQEGPGGRYESGMYIWDRPEATSAQVLKKFETLATLPAGPERTAFLERMREAGELERFRAFVGRDEDGAAMLELADPQARPRLRVRVGADDEPRIEFLDAEGKVTYALTSNGPESATPHE